jgi:hypothetical protein
MTDMTSSSNSRTASQDDNRFTRHIEPLAVEDNAQEFELTGLNLITVISGLVLAIFLVSLDSAIVATAIPYVTAEFKSAGDTAWYGSAYTLATCALQPIAGKLYAKFSIKASLVTILSWKRSDHSRQCSSSSWHYSKLDRWYVPQLQTL